MTWSPYLYDSRDPGSLKRYGDMDPGPQFHINIGTRGPHSGMTPVAARATKLLLTPINDWGHA